MEEEKIINLVNNTITNYFDNKNKEEAELEKSKNEELSKINTEKNIEFHSQSINAWYMTSLEKDKSILTISAGGIGVMITLLTTIGISGYLTFSLFCLSILSFLISILLIINVFGLNKEYLTAVIGQEDTSCFKIEIKDKIAIVSLILGIIFAITIGLTVAFDKLNEKVKSEVILNK